MKNFKSLLLIPLVVPLVVAAPSFANSDASHVDSSTCEEILKALVTVSFDSVLAEGQRHPAVQKLSMIYKQRSAESQAGIDEIMRENHLRKEMSFQVRNPKTGFYDRFVSVPVNGHIAPIMKTDYDRMVRSTGPVLRALRGLLQKVYSQKELSVRALGLEKLPASEAELVLKVIRESIYLEPFFIAPQMAEYPFLAVSGFDGAVVDPKKPKNVFFEMNLGTPSGLSNNAELLGDLEESDPEVFAAIRPYLPRDKTYSILRETIERNAFAWTRSSGIAVVISPGIFNGAHPDVATIAKRAGLPLVKSSDLYEDARGNIRLNTGAIESHPIVTGIYNRMEESFLFQSLSENIPMISPQYTDQSALAARTGLDLKPGVIYKWVYDGQGAIIDVERDAEGKPLLEEVWDTIGQDPARPEAPRGSFAKAVLSRKLYVSNLGGRVVDDKRLFRIVSEYLAERGPGIQVAGPVKGLSPDRLGALFKSPDQFVIKAPANSGGVGIYFPRTMGAAEKEALLAQVRLSPQDYEVQYVSPIATLPHADQAGFNEVAMDLRIFVMMDETGHVDAGSNSILLRTAPAGGLYSNTSRGGGYGIGVVLSGRREHGRSDASYYVSTQAASDQEAIYQAMVGLKFFLMELESAESLVLTSEKGQELKERALWLSFEFRGILHNLPRGGLSLPSTLRDFAENETLDVDDLGDMAQMIESAFSKMRFEFGPMTRAFNRLIQDDTHWWLDLQSRMEDPTSASYSPLNRKIKYRRLREPVVAYYRDFGSTRYEKYEMAEIVSVDDLVLQGMIDFVKNNGGQVRMMKTRMVQGAERRLIGWRFESPYFWVNLDPQSKSYLVPVIGIDLTGDRAIAALAHEIEHFKIWLAAYRERLALGLDNEAAARAAVDYVWQQDMIVYGERMAVDAEMKAERDYPNHPFNQARGMLRPTEFWQRGYLNRITYPEYQAVRYVLHQHVAFHRDLDMEVLRKYLTQMVQRALEVRAQALAHLGPDGDFLLRDYWEFTPISSLLLKPYGAERLVEERTLDLFNLHLEEICKEITGSTLNCGS